MPKLPRSTSSATSSMASGTIPSRPAKPHPDWLKIMHLFPDRPLVIGVSLLKCGDPLDHDGVGAAPVGRRRFGPHSTGGGLGELRGGRIGQETVRRQLLCSLQSGDALAGHPTIYAVRRSILGEVTDHPQLLLQADMCFE